MPSTPYQTTDVIQTTETPNPKVGFANDTIAFYGAAGVAKQTVTGAKGGNVALTNLMAALVALGLVVDTTS